MRPGRLLRAIGMIALLAPAPPAAGQSPAEVYGRVYDAASGSPVARGRPAARGPARDQRGRWEVPVRERHRRVACLPRPPAGLLAVAGYGGRVTRPRS